MNHNNYLQMLTDSVNLSVLKKIKEVRFSSDVLISSVHFKKIKRSHRGNVGRTLFVVPAFYTVLARRARSPQHVARLIAGLRHAEASQAPETA